MTLKESNLRVLLLSLSCALMLVACAGAPVQELSDARQALNAARAVGSDLYMPDAFAQAERYLARASRDLDAGDYQAARRAALSAKEYAVLAREAALAAQSGP